MQNFKLIAAFIFISAPASSQQLLKTNVVSKQETEFAFRVKHIDEFYDRFNAKKDILITSYIQKTSPGLIVTRPQLIKSLINKSNTFLIKDTIVNSLIANATDSLRPQFLNFNDTNWFALLKCSALYKSKAVKINLTLRVDYHIDGSSEWALYDADGDFIRKMNFNPDSFLFVNNLLPYFLRTADTIKYYLHPMSHALDFMNLDKVFTDKTKFINYTYQSKPNASLKKLFISNFNNQFRFLQVDSIKFYLLQLSGKILKVEEFNRSSNNSGWLINDIENINDKEKYKYLDLVTRLHVAVPKTGTLKRKK